MSCFFRQYINIQNSKQKTKSLLYNSAVRQSYVECSSDTFKSLKRLKDIGLKIKRITMKVKQKKGTNLPGAWIVNPKDKGRKSIKGDKIYLDNGQEFEIEIFNPLKESVLADIRLNGNSICKTGLVIKPGQRVYLDCFVDDRKKFIFQTYEIDGSQESLDATADNGLLEVFFYKEQAVTLQNWIDKYHKVVIHEYYPVYYPRWYSYPYYGGLTLNGTTGTIYTTNTANTLTINTGSSTYGGVLNNSNYETSFTNCSLTSGGTSESVNAYYNSVAGSLETGRVEKGEKSDQQFVDVDMDFEKNYIHHLVYQILPSSRKPKEIKEISKRKDILEKLRNDNKNHHSDVTIDLIELIKKLADLHSAGILTDEEFSSKKSELLSKI